MMASGLLNWSGLLGLIIGGGAFSAALLARSGEAGWKGLHI